MKKDDHYLAGSLLKTSGIKGEVLLKFNNDCPEEIQKLESIFIDVDNKLVPFFIEKIKSKSSSTAVVNFEGIISEEKSEEFIGLDFYISYEQVDLLNVSADEFIDVAGYNVKDQNSKLIGVVIEYIDIAKNPLLNVKTQNGEILIPAKDELIIEVDDDLKEILINIPEGLLDLN
jgi:16S rRNA processing protein RimM